MEDDVKKLIGKAKDAPSADEAMKFAQAALNAANALRVMVDTKKLT